MPVPPRPGSESALTVPQRVLARVDALFDRLYGCRYNPLYQSGTLAVLLLLVLIVCRTLAAGATEGVRWAFYGGLALDLCGSAPLGSHALALLAAALLIYLLSRRLRGEHWLIPIVACFIGAFVYEVLLALIYTVRVAPLDWRIYLVVALLPAALLAMVPALPVYMVLRQFERRRRDAALEL